MRESASSGGEFVELSATNCYGQKGVYCHQVARWGGAKHGDRRCGKGGRTECKMLRVGEVNRSEGEELATQ
ncbi:hypothetical protein BaRGS_00000040 [Batillaria attramentaria]|uniref:Uncharacterized protein n=1 Tax=Batillaria attramentaria TaxID=370345 RepID=A0ABD0M9F3_9CAEN